MIVKFSDWLGHHPSGMRRACLLSGVGVDGHMGGWAAHYTALVLYCAFVLHMGCVTCVMCTSMALLV